MTVSQIKSQLKKLAEDFDLKYDPAWFSHIWIPTRLEILSEYIGDCPDPIYVKYGKTSNPRIANINKFVSSKDFRDCLKRYGGQVASKSGINKELNWAKKIPNKELKKEMLAFYNKLSQKLNKTPYIALLTIPKNKHEEYWQLKFVLRHEWIHILLSRNKIDFQKAKSKAYWPYDEGINEYMGAYLDKTLNKLKQFKNKEKYPMEKKGWIYAIKFKKLFKHCKTPKERRKALTKFMRNLK